MADSIDGNSPPSKPVTLVSPSRTSPFALERLEEAVDSAFSRGALSTATRLSLRLSQLLLFTANPSYVKAIEYAKFAYEAAQACVSDHHIQDLAFDLDLHLQLGKLCYLREEYQQAEEHLKRVLQVASTMMPTSRLAGDAAATLALVHRARRDPLGALAYCWVASPVLASLHARNAHTRLLTTVVETALDVLEQRGSSQHYVDIATSRLSAALRGARLCGDPSTAGMVHLARARYARIVVRSGESVSIIEEIRRDAATRHDMGLLAQAHSALGFDLMDRGFADGALDSFGRALTVAGVCEQLCVSGPPRRAILLRHEFGIG